MSPNRSLADWLDYQQTVHVRGVDLGLDRVRTAWQRLGAPRPAPLVISVGGTNGKGSTVAFLEAMLRAMGHRVGCYTSPHLLRYNERVRIDGRDVDDAALIAAFERIEAARLGLPQAGAADPATGAIPLTYFEYGTLAAFELFARAGVDVAVLEVGLGGRLDAVNLIDADAAIVTTIDLDHQEWLGDTRDAIGREKAGIFRPGRPAVVGEAAPPQGLLDAAQAVGARLLRQGREFHREDRGAVWRWSTAGACLDLPRPQLAGRRQLDNAAAAIAALHALRERCRWSDAAVAAGVAKATVAGRLQAFPGTPLVLVDVAHNPQAARELAAWLAGNPVPGRTLAVFGALADKDVGGILAALGAYVADWFGAALDAATARGRSAGDLGREFAAAGLVARTCADVDAALDAAADAAQPQDRVLAFGSFFVAAAAIAWARRRGPQRD